MTSRASIAVLFILAPICSCALIDSLTGADDSDPGADASDPGPDSSEQMPICSTSIFLGVIDDGRLTASLSPCNLGTQPILDLASQCGGPTAKSAIVFEFDARSTHQAQICAAQVGQQTQTFVVQRDVCSEFPAGQCIIDSDCQTEIVGPGVTTIYWESGGSDPCPVVNVAIDSSMAAY